MTVYNELIVAVVGAGTLKIKNSKNKGDFTMKKTNNKGFSLVELIVVVAIMAVLIGVLAPQFLRYVEKSRIQKDNSAIAEIANACKIAMADETINTNTTSGTTVAASSAEFTFFTTGSALVVELNKAVGGSVKLTSNAYKAASEQPTITITKDTTSGTITVTGSNLLKSDGTAETAAITY